MDPTVIFSVISSVVAAIAGAAGLGASGTVRFVHEGERGLRLRFGKVVLKDGQPKVIRPGWCWVWPGIEKLVRTHVRQRVQNCGNQEVTLKDETVFTVDAVLVYRVGDTPTQLYSALFEVTDLNQAVRLYCIGALREVVQVLDFRELISLEPAEMQRRLTEKVSAQLGFWGLIVDSFKLGDLSPYGNTLALIQTGTAARFRMQALRQVTEGLGMDAATISPQLAAALVGVPVAVGVGVAPDAPHTPPAAA